ncbi:Uncharacterised protein [Salmonella enterica subsp. enterica serovar Typhimurium str. DT104]|nr:Uncharacterised protein [Salmonella enterica subsp. enterica serovar Typhimurium str. DT104]CFE31387.1 Uncharacterised protein [Salmonella enterica subsp. enterica serovar Typhimurium str. DT104]CFE38791.1 Uncharacterised protein [Salmonella enterica subsp. enterica serovar Typhimurium str. DT104]CFV20818.1 Uncharacterised protein [Salmonella enterica subsp. enterica serovar Typhimurium str. DT104]CNN91144.1 Uncharacterised protein [Salmonella enterica subsp. enterica serovar Typhimurium str
MIKILTFTYVLSKNAVTEGHSCDNSQLGGWGCCRGRAVASVTKIFVVVFQHFVCFGINTVDDMLARRGGGFR